MACSIPYRAAIKIKPLEVEEARAPVLTTPMLPNYGRPALQMRTLYFGPVVSSIFYLFSSPNLSGRRVDVYHTSTHGVALVQI